MRIVKLFRNAVKTQDGRIWNLGRVVKCVEPDRKETGIGAGTMSSRTPVRVSGRVARLPNHLRDYELY